MTDKTTKATAAVDPRIVRAYANLASKTRRDEVAFIADLAGRLESGTATVKIAAASIREASKTATAPTVRASHVQDIRRAHAILSGATDVDSAPLRHVLTMATRLRKGYGSADVADTRTAELIAAKVPFTEWDAMVPATNAKNDAGEESGEESGKDGAVVKGQSADAIIRATLEALRGLEDIEVTDRQAAADLVALIRTLAGAK